MKIYFTVNSQLRLSEYVNMVIADGLLFFNLFVAIKKNTLKHKVFCIMNTVEYKWRICEQAFLKLIPSLVDIILLLRDIITTKLTPKLADDLADTILCI